MGNVGWTGLRERVVRKNGIPDTAQNQSNQEFGCHHVPPARRHRRKQDARPTGRAPSLTAISRANLYSISDPGRYCYPLSAYASFGQPANPTSGRHTTPHTRVRNSSVAVYCYLSTVWWVLSRS